MSVRRWLSIAALLLAPWVLLGWVPDRGGVWSDGSVPIALDLVATAPGTGAPWDAAAREAVAAWNAHLERVQLTAVGGSGAPWYDNGRSEVFFDNRFYGERFPTGVLAITVVTADAGQRVEADVIFNRDEQWSVATGPVTRASLDFRRVLIHELGHVLGLDHPDDFGQRTSAIMNSTIGDTETPTPDDQAGARALYDRAAGAAPVIVGGPVVDFPDAPQGMRVKFRVQVGGRGPFSYSWRREGQPVPGGNAATLIRPAVGLADAGSYTVVVTNAGGSVTSAPVRLAVTPAVAPSAAPAFVPEITRTVGEDYTIHSLLNEGSFPRRFEWFLNGRSIGTSVQSNFTLRNLQFSDAGTYTVTATNAAGSATAPAARLLVVPRVPTLIVRGPASRAVALGERVVLSGEADGASLRSYRWQKDGVDIPGAIDPSYSIASFQGSDAGSYTFTLSASGRSILSAPAILTLLTPASAPPTVIVPPLSRIETAGATLEFAITCEGPVTARWFKDGVALADSAPLAALPGKFFGAATTQLRISDTTAQDAGVYRVEVSNAFGTISRTAQLTVLPGVKPLITTQPSAHHVGVGDTVTLSVTVRRWFADRLQSLPDAPHTFQWFKDGQPISGAGNSVTFTATLADQGRYFVRVSSPAGSTDSSVVDVTVTTGERPLITVQPPDQLYDAGDPEVLRVAPVAFVILGRRAARQAESTAVQLVNASGPPIGGVVPGTYVVVATRGAVTEVSRPFALGFIPATAPVIFTSPSGRTLDLGERVELFAGVASYAPASYQWQKNGVAIAGATTGSLIIPAFTAADAGDYTLTVTNSAGASTSAVAVLAQRPAGLPIITQHPASTIVRAGGFARLEAHATGGQLRYEWLKDGVPVPNQRTEFFSSAVSPADAGIYVLRVTNGTGSVLSRSAVVTVLPTDAGPVVIEPPANQTAPLGADVTFTAEVDGNPPPSRYQWLKDGVPIPGATDVELRLRNVQPTDAARYSVAVSDAKGTVTSPAGTLTVDARARLVNLSTRANVGVGADLLIAGFVIGGAEPRTILVRGIGDQLAEFGLRGVLRNPALRVFDGRSRLVASSDDWAAGSDSDGDRLARMEALMDAARATGAFALREDTRDAALIATLPPGSYTAQVSGAVNTTGVGLVEIYEVGRPGQNRLINLSSRAFVGTGAGVLIPGLVLQGTAPRRLLIRAVGAGLATFGVAGVLADPIMSVYAGSERIAQNDNWSAQSNAAEIARVTASVGAFALPEASRDAVLLLELAPGTYTVQVAGVNSSTGIALVEVYELP